MDNLLKFGSERCIDEAKERIFQIKTLIDFQYSDPNTMKDCGTGIREKAKQMYEFLNDNESIKRARAEARKHVDKYKGFSNEDGTARYSGDAEASYGGSGRYDGGSYDSEDYGSKKRAESPEKPKKKSSSKSSSRDAEVEEETESSSSAKKSGKSKGSSKKKEDEDDDFDFGYVTPCVCSVEFA